MRVLVKADAKTCQKCKYHIGFGSQPGKEQKKAGHYKNVACNYLAIEGHSRIFENAEMTAMLGYERNERCRNGE